MTRTVAINLAISILDGPWMAQNFQYVTIIYGKQVIV